MVWNRCWFGSVGSVWLGSIRFFLPTPIKTLNIWSSLNCGVHNSGGYITAMIQRNKSWCVVLWSGYITVVQFDYRAWRSSHVMAQWHHVNTLWRVVSLLFLKICRMKNGWVELITLLILNFFFGWRSLVSLSLV